MMDQFEKMLDSESPMQPLQELVFYKDIYENYFWSICGYPSIHAFKVQQGLEVRGLEQRGPRRYAVLNCVKKNLRSADL